MNERMNRKKFNIGTYILQQYAQTEEHIKALADCGIDFVTCMDNEKNVLDLFSKYGIGAVVNDVLPSWWGGNGEKSGTMNKCNPISEYEKAAAAFVDHPAIWGIDAGDEPSAMDFDHYGKIISRTEKLFPHQFIYLNLYPNYASVAKNTMSETECQLGTKTYAEHIESYIRRVPTDYICYDHYVYSTRSAPLMYENFRIVSDACRESGRSFWYVPQVNSNRPEEWISTDRLRYQAYTAMAFGAENIIWACWTAGWWTNQVVDENGNQTQQYDKLKTVNFEIKAFADEYMKYRNVSTDLIGIMSDSSTADIAGKPAERSIDAGAFMNICADDGCNIAAGHMVSRSVSSSEAIMLCDAGDPYCEKNTAYNIYFTLHCSREPAVWINGVKTAPKLVSSDGDMIKYSVGGGTGRGIFVTI
ncbi:MAG: hypothetical protein WCQ72_01120 [Eubacteriales bacterium]